MLRKVIVLAFLLALAPAAQAQDNLLVGGDFEQGLTGWSKAWSRAGVCEAKLDRQQKRGGEQALRVEHTGADDWSLGQEKRQSAVPGEIYELAGWMQVQGKGYGQLCVVLYDAQGKAIDWSYGGREVRATDGWQEVRTRFIVPPGTKEIWPRLIGAGPTTVRLDDASLRRTGSIKELQSPDLPKEVAAENAALKVAFSSDSATFTVTDRRTQQQWKQQPAAAVIVLDARPAAQGFSVKLLDPTAMRPMAMTVKLEGDRPEVAVELAAEGEMHGTLAYPGPFTTAPGTLLIMPVNEGISYPVDDKTLRPMHYHLYGGHGLCMPWYGVTDGQRGMMTLVETADDAAVRTPQINGLLCLAPEWQPQKGQFGPARRLRYVFFNENGYVAMCKRYRQYAKETGLLKTLLEKRAENPNVDRLIGAVNVWCWSGDPVEWCREMKSAGIDRILWSNRTTPDKIRAMNEMGVLTSRYDIYQDTMNPAEFPKLRGVHSDWTTEAWPDDLMLDARGDWIRGWQVTAKDGSMIPCGVLCDRQAIPYARQRIGEERKTHPYLGRFIDTTTASPWRECYDPDHPCTRSESKKYKMDLLAVVSREFNLVTGCETGHDASVPYLHFFEGMMSLGPYRVPDSGRKMQEILDEVPERVAKFQTGHYYRLPLWELVYHDCTVSYWYWGDYNNKLPSLWDRRDLLNALYGTPPMFMFNREFWQKNRDRFVRSYRDASTVAHDTGYAEMLSHRWLTEDHSVQQTEFANGVTVTVNFGDQPYKSPSGDQLAPLSQRVQRR